MIKFIFTGLIYVLGLIYMIQPVNNLPTLSNAARSDEPGDTWQNPDQAGYYTNMVRSEVISNISSNFKLSIFDFSIPSIRLNYRPEDAQLIIRDQLQSNYMEEIVYPLHHSIYINGWEPKKSPLFADKPAKEIPDISLHGIAYDAKITLKPVVSNLYSRVLVWTAIFPLTYLVFLSLKKSFIYG